MSVRLTLSDPSVKGLAKASCSNSHYNNLPKLLGETNWQEWCDALQHVALMAGTDAVLNGESKHPPSLDEQSTTPEWNENIKRTAVWRRRNESLLKAMRKASAVDLTDGANAHQTYLNLKSQYHTSDNQRVQALYEEHLMLPNTELADSPRDIADSLQSAFDQYNQLVGRNIEQRLPENFLKMEFLTSLDSAYNGWLKILLKEQNVLALDQGSTLTFNELVDLVIAERTRLLQEQTNNTASVPAPATTRQTAKRNISQVDEPAQPDLRKPRSSPRHNKFKHKNPNSKDTSSDDSGSEDETDSEVEAETEEQISAADQDRLSVEHEIGDHNRVTIENWQDLVAARHAELKAQRDVVTVAFDNSANKRRTYPTLRGDLTGEWLLYNKKFNPGTGGHHHIRIWDNISEKQKRLHPKTHEYGGKLFIGPRGKAETFEIRLFSPSHKVTGRRQPILLTRGKQKSRKGWMIFWGDGKMLVTVPAPVSGKIISMEFAGIQRKADGSDGEGNNDQNGDYESSSDDDSDSEERYDRIIRTERRASMAIKVEEDENTTRVRGIEEAIMPVAIKAEESDPSDTDNE